jgi:tetratricopeptide (TPR) repeat protein
LSSQVFEKSITAR